MFLTDSASIDAAFIALTLLKPSTLIHILSFYDTGPEGGGVRTQRTAVIPVQSACILTANQICSAYIQRVKG